MELPAAWQEASRRPPAGLADPLPERRLARLLGAFIAAGLLFLVLPGTLLGVWNLIGISSRQAAGAIPPAWIQGHGHAQLFGWVGTFIIGISLYTFPKFRGSRIRSLAGGWIMFGLWTAALAARWASALGAWHWNIVWPLSAAAELLVVLLLFWQCTGPGRTRRRAELWDVLVFAGFAGFAATLAWQLVVVWPPLPAPVIPDAHNRVLLSMALWLFCFPVAWGYSHRFLPSFLGLGPAHPRAAYAGLGLLPLGIFFPAATLAAVLLACVSLGIFRPAARPAKTLGVDPRYPVFIRVAFVWLAIAAALPLAGVIRECRPRGYRGARRGSALPNPRRGESSPGTHPRRTPRGDLPVGLPPAGR